MADEKTKYSLSIDGVKAVINGLNKVEGGFGGVGTKISEVTGATGLLAAVTGAITVGGFAAMVKGSIDAADGLNDLSKSTGISVEDLSGLKLVAEQSGTTLEGLGKSVNKMSEQMGRTPDIFAKIGITAKDPIKALGQVADVFVSIEDPQQRAAFAAKVFGKQWEQLAPTLSLGSTEIERLTKRGQELSGVTQAMADQADNFNDKVAELEANAHGLATTIAKELLPTLNNALDDMQDGIKIAGSFGSALMLFGFSSPFGTAAEQVKKYRDELDGLDASIGRYKRANSDTTALEQARIKTLQQLQLAEARQRREMDYSDDNESTAEKTRLGLIQGKKAPPKGLAGFIDGGAAVAAANKDLLEQSQLLAKLSGLSTSFYQDWDKLSKAYGAHRISLDQLTEAQAALLAEQPAMKEMLKVELDAAEARMKSIETLTAGLTKMQDDVKTQQDLNDRMGLSKTAIADLDAVRLEEQATILDGIAIKQLDKNLDTEQYDLYKSQAEQLRKLAGLKQAGADKETLLDEQKKTAEEAQKIWDNFTENVQHNLGDGLYNAMNGTFDGIGASFRSMLQHMLADAMAAKLTEALFGSKTGGSMGGAGVFGSIVDAGMSLFGGGMTLDTGGVGLTAGGPGLADMGLGGGRASGGPVDPATLYRVNERGPELLTSGGKDYLMMGAEGGTVTPNDKLGGKSVSITYAPTINVDSRADRVQTRKETESIVEAGHAKLVDQLRRARVI